ncbi:OLC1v1017035C1 [Oldenlandia corymbosa var. corymbosa]|uniref:OLC1v1017035C1 n=1 Tax=Oldenlandia corymbosa var. corymbosa TaxID=529605 RepID=A0AAV1E8I9_OLDCO|nr:OLC1v1017035C1 [Oldenlandia corymbosa var. corymbosa]
MFMAAATSSSSSSSFFNLRPNEAAAVKVRSPPSCGGGGGGAGGRIDGMAMWIINGVATAFFASLERCSCIRIATVDDGDGDDSNDLPLIFNDGNSSLAAARDISSFGRKRSSTTGKGKKNGVLIY